MGRRIVPHLGIWTLVALLKKGSNRRPMSTANTIARTPEPPYYAVIFTSTRTRDERGYGTMAERMVEMASKQPGFLGVESVRDADGFGITVSYWQSEEAIRAWKAVTEHKAAQETGRRTWYVDYEIRVAKVERQYGKQTPSEASG